MSVRPLEDRVLVRPLEPETKTESGIYLPESAKEKPMQGKVVAVGPGKLLDTGERVKPSVKKGDTVVFGKYAGNEITIDDDKLMVMKEEEIWAIV